MSQEPMNPCGEVEEHLAELLEGNGPEHLYDHLAGCDRCRDLRHDAERLEHYGRDAGADHVIPNDLSTAEALVDFIDDALDGAPVGICLDVGHAHLNGDVVDQLETVAEHLIATHLHDNRGRTDEHLVPFEGTVNWPGTLTTLRKVGYDGVLTFELAGREPYRSTLERARHARAQVDRLLNV